MSSQPSNLFALARSKLNPSDKGSSFSLHRWVLLKNSVIQSLPLVAASPPSANTPPTSQPSDEDDADEEGDAFMFPDAGQLMGGLSTEATASEAAWLDSLLETLGDDDEDYLSSEVDVHVSAVPVDDDDDLLQSPPISPMSSSDDLTTPSCYPFLVPYPPSLAPSSSLVHYVNPLPYCDLDDLEDLPPVPDAIEDTSDDESDTPPTPGQSLSSLALDPASIPLPAEHSRLRQSYPHIYMEEDDDEYFYPFDPLPFPQNPPIQYPEC